MTVRKVKDRDGGLNADADPGLAPPAADRRRAGTRRARRVRPDRHRRGSRPGPGRARPRRQPHAPAAAARDGEAVRWGWMARSAWEASKPLPGSLADETPDPQRVSAEAGRWQPRYDDGTIPTPIHDRLQREYSALLLERDDALAKLAAAEERIRGLELTVAAQAGRLGPLRVADDDLLIQPLPKEAGR